jgi:serine/threonine protein kinase
MEYVECGTLHDCIQTSDEMSEATVQHIIRQILCALEYMHERHQVSHRDLKPAVFTIQKISLTYRTFFFAIEGHSQLSRLRILDLQRLKRRQRIIHSAVHLDISLQNVLKDHRL